MSIQLSVNVNKIATLRNSRGGNIPDILKFCKIALDSGAYGITVHPREDERHITKEDILKIKHFIDNYNFQNGTSKEYNIEGELSERFFDIVLQANPNQVTLVPVMPNEITSHQGFKLIGDTADNLNYFINLIKKNTSSRVSIFMETDLENLSYLKNILTDRIEFYTGPFAFAFEENVNLASEVFAKYVQAANLVSEMGFEINAGHDLDLDNLTLFKKLPKLQEVSIGHRLISYSLEVGFEKAIKDYLDILKVS